MHVLFHMLHFLSVQGSVPAGRLTDNGGTSGPSPCLGLE